MLEINSKKDAGELVAYLLNLAEEQIEYTYYADIDEIAYLLGAAKSIARISELMEYTEISLNVARIKEKLIESMKKSMILLNRV